MKTITLKALFAVAAILAVSGSATAAESSTMKYMGTAATSIINNLKRSEGWAMVSARQKVNLVPGAPAIDCVRYRVVTNYKVSKLKNNNGHLEDVVELTYGAATDWIAVDLKMPTNSCTSFSAAKAANTAVGAIDELIGLLTTASNKEKNAQAKADVLKAIKALRLQRAALVDLIQKDIAAIK